MRNEAHLALLREISRRGSPRYPVSVSTIQAGSITAGKIQANAITAEKLGQWLDEDDEPHVYDALTKSYVVMPREGSTYRIGSEEWDERREARYAERKERKRLAYAPRGHEEIAACGWGGGLCGDRHE